MALSICPYIPSIFLSFPLFSVFHSRVEEMQQHQYQIFFLPCHSQSPPLALPLLFLFSFSCMSLSSSASTVDHSLSFSIFLVFPAVGQASHRHVESRSVWRLAALLSLCTTSLHHTNLWLALHRGPLTTHACLHATLL